MFHRLKSIVPILVTVIVKMILFIYVFWLCWVFSAAWAFLWLHRMGLLFAVVFRLLTAVASVAEHRL